MRSEMSSLDDDTVDRSDPSLRGAPARVLAMTIAWHPDPRRAGETAWTGSAALSVSRKEPRFAPSREPLGEPGISRAPFTLERTPRGELVITRGEHAAAIEVEGVPVDRSATIGAAELDRGVVLELAHRVALVLRYRALPSAGASDALGLLGASEAIDIVRDQVLKVAGTDAPVLITGESGTGKELIASSIVAASARAARPFVAVNLAATPPSLAASELFGHVKGAFTGADRAREGLFEQADGGSLFLDEVGDAPADLQVMLLRTLETGELRPVGGSSARKVDVRLLAATDVDLESAIERGSFRQALLERIAGYRIAMAPLRERREDIGLLLHAFVRRELEALGMAERLEPGDHPWLPSGLVARLVRASWPGNVRQLRNVARQLVISNRDAEQARLDAVLEGLLGPEPREEAAKDTSPGLPASDGELLAVLREHRFELRKVARVLGVSRSSLYARIDKSDCIRKARDLRIEDIDSARARVGDDLETLAGELEVSPRGLQLRLRELSRA